MSAPTTVAARARQTARADTASPARSPSGPAEAAGPSEGASLLAADFAGQRSSVQAAAWDPGTALAPRPRVRADDAGAPPLARTGGSVRWLSQPAANARGPLLDLQRLAGNGAVARALQRGPAARPPRDTTPRAGPSAEPSLQRLEIPGLGDVDISGYISRALSILGPAEESRDKARTDARTQADDAAQTTDAAVASGNQQLDAGKIAAEQAGETGFTEAQAGTDAAATAGRDETAAGKAHGDHVAQEISGIEGSVEGMVDPLAREAGSSEGDAGHQAIDQATEHAVQPSGAADHTAPQEPGIETVPGQLTPTGAEPAVSHGPGPPGPEAPTHNAGAPAPATEHGPAQAGGGADHGAPAPEPGQAPAAGPSSPAQAPTSAVPGGQSATPAGGGSQPKPATPSGASPAGAPGPKLGADAGGVAAAGAPTCALVEALKTVTGWRDKVKSFASGVLAEVGKTQIPGLGITVAELAGKARQAALWVKKGVDGIKDKAVAWAHKKAAGIKKTITDKLATAKRVIDATVTGVKTAIKGAREVVSGLWDAARDGVSATIQQIRVGAGRLVQAAIGRVRSFVNGLPGPVRGLLGAAGNRIRSLVGGDPLGDAAAYLSSRWQAAKDGLRRAKEGAVKVAKAVADSTVKVAATKVKEATTIAKGVVDTAKTVAPYVLGVAAPGAVAVAGAARAAAGQWGKQLRDGADRVKKAIKGEACEAIGETVGPCLDMYLPKPDNKEKGFAKLSGQADVTVPLHEVGVPCNVKVGRGASVSVERTSSGYGVAVDGDAFVFANLAAGKQGTKTEAKVELPTGGMATVWEHLSGVPAGPPAGGPAPATPATGGAPAAPAPTGPAAGAPAAPKPRAPGQAPGGGGPDVSGEVEGGVKGSANLKFSFPTAGATTCEGAGGVASLLGALGVAASLPAPLDVLAKSGVVGGWEGNLVSNTVTMGIAGGGQVEVSEEGLGALKAQGQGETYMTTGVERPDQSTLGGTPTPAAGADPGTAGGVDKNLSGSYAKPATGSDPNALRPVLKIGTAVKGEAAAELAASKLMPAKAGVSGSARIEALLLYDKPADRIILQSVTASGELGVSVGGINPALVASQLASPVGPAAAAKITSLGLAHSNGSIKASVTGKADNLQKYIDTVGKYLGGPPSGVSASGLASAVRAVHAPGDFSTAVQVTATLSDRIGMEGKVEQLGKSGEKLGASAKGSLEIGKEYQLYP